MGEKSLDSSLEIPRSEDDGDSLKPVKLQWSDFVKGLKREWKRLWYDRIDDKVRAEGVAREDYPVLFVDRGTVIMATKKYKPPDFVEILNLHQQMARVGATIRTWPSPSGWGRFVREVIRLQPRFSLRERPRIPNGKKDNLQKKKGGRGWVHQF